MDVGLSSSSFCSSFPRQCTLQSVYVCMCVVVASRLLVAGWWCLKCQTRMERSGSSACHMEAGQHNVLINSKHGQSSNKEFIQKLLHKSMMLNNRCISGNIKMHFGLMTERKIKWPPLSANDCVSQTAGVILDDGLI